MIAHDLFHRQIEYFRHFSGLSGLGEYQDNKVALPLPN
jgi:hypothetical protein